jgi:multimeric flavodoxin WrbA
VERVLEGAKAAGAEVEFVDIGDLDVKYCTGCGACHVTGNCPLKDDFGPIREKMLAADGIVLGSPLYFNTVTAQLKTVIDRLSQVVHCQMFLGKYGCSVATSGAPEYELATDYMNEILTRLGCTVVGSAGAAPAIPGAMEAAEKDALALGADLVKAFNEQRTYPEQEAVHAEMHERFKRLLSFNKDNWPWEHKYWAEHGWL